MDEGDRAGEENKYAGDVGPVDVVKSKCQGACCTDPNVKPMPVVIHCPNCGVQHVDQGTWATTLHRKHRCVDWEEVVEKRNDNDVVTFSAKKIHRGCGFEWTPSLIHTVGVRDA